MSHKVLKISGRKHEVLEVENLDLETLQELIGGGWIERVTFGLGFAGVVDEEGEFKRVELGTTQYNGYPFAGPVIVMREEMTAEGMDFVGLQDDDIPFLLQMKGTR